MEKFDTYDREDGKKQRIDLHKNFRSRSEVLDSVNFLFEQLMTKPLGGITYDEKAALYLRKMRQKYFLWMRRWNMQKRGLWQDV